MVSYFLQKHNSHFYKLLNSATIHIIAYCIMTLFVVASASAQSEIVLKTNEDSYYVTPQFTIYNTDPSISDFEDFFQSKQKNPFAFSTQTSFQFMNEGLWLHARVNNLTNDTKWMLSIRYAQILDARAYVVIDDEIIYQGQDGTALKSSNFSNPTFELVLPKYQSVDVYVYISSSNMALLVPIYLQTPDAQYEMTIQDYLIWGGLYGTLVIFALYTVIVTIKHRNIAYCLLLIHIAGLLIWQFNWSGHTEIVNNSFSGLLAIVQAEALFVLLCISSSTFTLLMLLNTELPKHLYVSLQSFIALCCVFFILFCFSN